jgi:hypothetical protein
LIVASGDHLPHLGPRVQKRGYELTLSGTPSGHAPKVI